MKLSKQERDVLDVLEHASSALPISDVATQAKLHRVTASKYLESLKDKGLVDLKVKGKAKLYSLNVVNAVREEIEKPALKDFNAISRGSERALNGSEPDALPVLSTDNFLKPLKSSKPLKAPRSSSKGAGRVSPIQKLAALELCRDGLLEPEKAARIVGLSAYEIREWVRAVKH